MRCGDYNFMIIEILLEMSVIFQNGTLECVYTKCLDDGFFIQNCFRDSLLDIATPWLSRPAHKIISLRTSERHLTGVHVVERAQD